MTEGFARRKTGRRSWRGEQIVCIKYAISPRPGFQLNWVQRKIFERRIPDGREFLPNAVTDHGISPPRSDRYTTRHIFFTQNLTWMEYEQRRGKKKMITKKKKAYLHAKPFAPRDVALSLLPSGSSVHAFSGEFALASGAMEAPGYIRAHMAIDAFRTPRAFFSYKTRTRFHQQIFLFQM